MNFSEEMKMLLQLQQLSKKNNPDVDIIQADYDRVLKSILSELKTQIRYNLIHESYPLRIEGNTDLPLNPSIKCVKVPQWQGDRDMYYYDTQNGINYFHWGQLCTLASKGSLFADKEICISLTAAGEKFLYDLSTIAKNEEIILSFQPAVSLKNGKHFLQSFGTVEKIANAQICKPLSYGINMHYLIE